MRNPMIKPIRFYLLSFLLLSCCVFAQVTSDRPFAGARALALGGSAVAAQQDAWAAFNNPSGLSRVTGIAAAFGYDNGYGYDFLSHSLFSAVMPVSRFGTVGLMFDRSGVEYGGNTLATETAIGLSHGFFLQKDGNSTLALGYNLKYLTVDYGKSAGASGDGSDGVSLGSSSTMGVDLGITASLRERYRVAARVSNINRPQMGQANFAADLPWSMQIGLAYSPYDLVWTTASMQRTGGLDTQYSAGIEYRILEQVALLTGVQSNPNRLGLGLRIELRSFAVDYGLLTHPVLPVTQQLSLGVAL